jgi:menaquinone-dependent protoporphyrinogen IX oxidase
MHTPEEVKIIREFVEKSDEKLSIEDLAKFINENIGVSWNTRDQQTRDYIQKFINMKNKKRKLN